MLQGRHVRVLQEGRRRGRARPGRHPPALNGACPRGSGQMHGVRPIGSGSNGASIMNRIVKLLALGGAAAMLAAGPAWAHAELVKSNPAANATVKSPKSITLTFNERLVPAFSKFELTMPAHHMTIPVKTTVSPDRKRIVG